MLWLHTAIIILLGVAILWLLGADPPPPDDEEQLPPMT